MSDVRRRILLVDDEPSIIKMIGKGLEVEGFDVLVAVDGEDGLEKATTQHPDLIVLDLMLPKLNGYEVCSRLKQDERYRHIPIVIFTGKGEDDQLSRECGADAYLTKGVGRVALIQKLKELLHKA